MKSASVSLEAAGVPSGNTFSAVFDRRLLLIGLWVFAGYYIGCKIGFALTFHRHQVSVLCPPASVLVPRCRVRGMESLGPRQLRAADPDTTIFKCSCGTNSRAVSSNVGDDRNFGPPDGPTFALLGSMRSLCWPVAGQLRCPV